MIIRTYGAARHKHRISDQACTLQEAFFGFPICQNRSAHHLRPAQRHRLGLNLSRRRASKEQDSRPEDDVRQLMGPQHDPVNDLLRQKTQGPPMNLPRSVVITYIHTYIHAYIDTCIHAYMHTCIRTYIHTCIHA